MTPEHGWYEDPELSGPDPLLEMVAKAHVVCRKHRGHETADLTRLRERNADLVAALRDSLTVQWERCKHDGIGRPGCGVCDVQLRALLAESSE